ncbi:MAG TPA: SprB repeat-containing protein, partial [Saprospiraceae bacterium]|nr:SprB repeat-containing protein [Saprospiraceae bacterium]
MKPFLAKIYSLIFGILILTNISFANSTTFSEGPPKLNTLNIELSITATNVTCNGLANGTASAIVSGGLAPYSYHWN